MGKNDDVFEAANIVIQDTVQEAFYGSVESVRRKIFVHVNNYANNFYKILVQAAQAGYLPEKKTPYQIKYSERKADLQVLNPQIGHGFYNLTGDLLGELASRNPVSDFGAPTVNFSTDGAGTLKEGFRRNKAGRIIRASGKGRGQFASTLEAIANLSAELDVSIFRRIQGKPIGQIFNIYPDQPEVVSITRQGMAPYRYKRAGLATRFRVNELGGPRGQASRPLLQPYLEFYSSIGLEQTLRKAFY